MRSGRTLFGPLLMAGLVWSWAPSANADDHIRGVVMGHGEKGTVFVQTDAGRKTVAVTEGTSIRMRGKAVGAEQLIPGLRIRADGTYETPDTLVATRVTFSKSDYKIAADIQGGIAPTQAAIQRQGEAIATNEQHIAATSGAVAATNARISNLDDFTSVKTLTVYFANGRYDLSQAQKAQLRELAVQAQGTQGYMISVAGYASAVGPDPLNQRLSMQRADAVTAILQQAGVPMANVMVPAAMGVSKQVAPNTTAKGQAENRRAVVTLLQNKGIAGR